MPCFLNFNCSSILYLTITTELAVLCLVSRVWLFVTPWTVAHQAPLFMGTLQARILEWVAMLLCSRSSPFRDRTQVFYIASGFFTIWATREAPKILEWVAYPFFRGIFPTQESNWSLLHCRQVIYQLSYWRSPITTEPEINFWNSLIYLKFQVINFWMYLYSFSKKIRLWGLLKFLFEMNWNLLNYVLP